MHLEVAELVKVHHLQLEELAEVLVLAVQLEETVLHLLLEEEIQAEETVETMAEELVGHKVVVQLVYLLVEL